MSAGLSGTKARAFDLTGMSTVPSAVSFDRTSLIWLLASVLYRSNESATLRRIESANDLHLDRDLSKVIGMRTRENLFVVNQILSRGGYVILDIGEIETLSFTVRVSTMSKEKGRSRYVRYQIWERLSSSHYNVSRVP